jgi:preprotein translocase subunit SecE
VERLRRFKQFLNEVWSELKKTTWPGRHEVYGTTMVVIITVLICAAYLWAVDLVLSGAMKRVFGVFGQ